MTSRALYVGLLAAFAAERLFELLISRANARKAFARGGSEVGRGHYPAMAILHSTFFVSAGAEVFVAPRSFPGWPGFVALGLVLLSQVLRYTAVSALGIRWNVRIIVWPSESPVTSGPYRFIRHPNYLAVAVEICFLPLVHGAWMTSVVFSVANACLLTVRIRAEERALGDLYADAFRGRPRFVPTLPDR